MEKSVCPAKRGTLCPIWYLLNVDQISSEKCTSCGSDPGSLGLEVSDKCLGADQHWKHVYGTQRGVCCTGSNNNKQRRVDFSREPPFAGFTYVLSMACVCGVFPCTFTLQLSRWEVTHLLEEHCILCKPWKQAVKCIKLGNFCQIKAQAWAPPSLESQVYDKPV